MIIMYVCRDSITEINDMLLLTTTMRTNLSILKSTLIKLQLVVFFC